MAAIRSRPTRPCRKRMNLLAHGAGVADDAPRPVEHALALGREALEPRAAVDQQHAQRLFELLEPGRKRRLGYAAAFGRTSEMLFPGQGQ